MMTNSFGPSQVPRQRAPHGLIRLWITLWKSFGMPVFFHFSGWACVLHVQINDLKNQLNQRRIFLLNQHVGQAAWLQTSMLSVDDSQETHLPLGLQAVGQSGT